MKTLHLSVVIILSVVCLAPFRAEALEKKEIVLSEDRIHLTVPEGWVQQQPQTRILDYEFSVPAVEGDERDARVTVMGAGGSVDANIDRWIGQFVQPDGRATAQRAKRETLKIAGHEVHFVDITGDYKDQAGPLAPAVMRDDYRMLGAIIVTDKIGQYFIKLYGPNRTVAANEKEFHKMLRSLQVNQ